MKKLLSYFVVELLVFQELPIAPWPGKSPAAPVHRKTCAKFKHHVEAQHVPALVGVSAATLEFLQDLYNMVPDVLDAT